MEFSCCCCCCWWWWWLLLLLLLLLSSSNALLSVIESRSKPNETSLSSISIDLFKKTTGGGLDCRFKSDDNDDEDE